MFPCGTPALSPLVLLVSTEMARAGAGGADLRIAAQVKSLGGSVDWHDGAPEKGIRTVNLDFSSMTDAKLRAILPHLLRLDRPFELNLFRSSVTDAGMKDIARVRKLRSVILYGTAVTQVHGCGARRSPRP